VSVDLGLENPDARLALEITLLLYVACTRVTNLQNFFVSPIHPSFWQRIGRSDTDKHRQRVDVKLQTAAKEFAPSGGKYHEMLDELAWVPDDTNNDAEWDVLRQQTEPPQKRNQSVRIRLPQTEDFDIKIDKTEFRMVCKPVCSERHIGIDQGELNFAIVVVERTIGTNPNIVDAKNYTNLQLKKNFTEHDVLIALNRKTDLLSWMQPTNKQHKVDRVIVHLEQISPLHKRSKQFSVALGKLLHQQVHNSDTCIVKMSQPHIHQATRPMFRLGSEIVDALHLKALLYDARTRADVNPAVVAAEQADDDSEPSDVEPSNTPASSATSEPKSREYRMKKKMSSDVFRYIVQANDQQLKQMQLQVNVNV